MIGITTKVRKVDTVNPPITAIAIGDLNGDGQPDLAVANLGDYNVSVLSGNGDGSFQNAVNFGTSCQPYSVAIGDFNGDSDLDLAVANRSSDSVSILLGNGNGSFQSPDNFAAGEDPQAVAIGDLNEDG